MKSLSWSKGLEISLKPSLENSTYLTSTFLWILALNLLGVLRDMSLRCAGILIQQFTECVATSRLKVNGAPIFIPPTAINVPVRTTTRIYAPFMASFDSFEQQIMTTMINTVFFPVSDSIIVKISQTTTRFFWFGNLDPLSRK